MTYPTPSQAEGEREEPDTRDTADEPTPERTTPSQAEGERDDGAGRVAGPTDSPQEREP
ncbi:hypothetical protein [Streptomyces aquilus]|nr:hypothetical protein [Streptomyces aquilus]